MEPPYLHSLIIQNPILADTGIYSCVAVNEGGRASTTATLTVESELENLLSYVVKKSEQWNKKKQADGGTSEN